MPTKYFYQEYYLRYVFCRIVSIYLFFFLRDFPQSSKKSSFLNGLFTNIANGNTASYSPVLLETVGHVSQNSCKDFEQLTAESIIESLKRQIKDSFDPSKEEGLYNLPDGYIYVIHNHEKVTDGQNKLYAIYQSNTDDGSVTYNSLLDGEVSSCVGLPAVYVDEKGQESAFEVYVYYSSVFLGADRAKSLVDNPADFKAEKYDQNLLIENTKKQIKVAATGGDSYGKVDMIQTLFKKKKGKSIYSEEAYKDFTSQEFWRETFVQSFFTVREKFAPVLMLRSPVANLMHLGRSVKLMHDRISELVKSVQESSEGKAALLLARQLYMSEYSGEREIKGLVGGVGYNTEKFLDFIQNLALNSIEEKIKLVDKDGNLINGYSDVHVMMSESKKHFDKNEDIRKAREVCDFKKLENTLKLNSRKFTIGLANKVQEVMLSLVDDANKDHLEETWQDIFSQDFPSKLLAEDTFTDLLMPLTIDMTRIDMVCDVEGHDFRPSRKFYIKSELVEIDKIANPNALDAGIIKPKIIYTCTGYGQTDYTRKDKGIWEKSVAEYDAAGNRTSLQKSYLDAKGTVLGSDYESVIEVHRKESTPKALIYLAELLAGKKSASKYILPLPNAQAVDAKLGHYSQDNQQSKYLLDTMLSTPISEQKSDLIVLSDEQLCKEALAYFADIVDIKANKDADDDYEKLKDIITKVLDKFKVEYKLEDVFKKLDLKFTIPTSTKDLSGLVKDFRDNKRIKNNIEDYILAVTKDSYATKVAFAGGFESLMLERYQHSYMLSNTNILVTPENGKLSYNETWLSRQLDVAQHTKGKVALLDTDYKASGLGADSHVKVRLTMAERKLLKITETTEYVDMTLEKYQQSQLSLNEAYNLKAKTILETNEFSYSGYAVHGLDGEAAKTSAKIDRMKQIQQQKLFENAFNSLALICSVADITRILNEEKISPEDAVGLVKNIGDIVEIGMKIRLSQLQSAGAQLDVDNKLTKQLDSLVKDSKKLGNMVQNEQLAINDARVTNRAKRIDMQRSLSRISTYVTSVTSAASLVNLCQSASSYMDSLKSNDKNLQASHGYAMASAASGLLGVMYEAAAKQAGGNKQLANKIAGYLAKKAEQQVVKKGLRSTGKELAEITAKKAVAKRLIIKGASKLATYAIPYVGWGLFICDVAWSVYSYIEWSNRDNIYQAYIKASQFAKDTNQTAKFKNANSQYSALLSIFDSVNIKATQDDKLLSVAINIPQTTQTMTSQIKYYIMAKAGDTVYMLQIRDNLIQNDYVISDYETIEANQSIAVINEDLITYAQQIPQLANTRLKKPNVTDEIIDNYKNIDSDKAFFSFITLVKVASNDGKILLTNDYLNDEAHYDEKRLREDDKNIDLVDRLHECASLKTKLNIFEDLKIKKESGVINPKQRSVAEKLAGYDYSKVKEAIESRKNDIIRTSVKSVLTPYKDGDFWVQAFGEKK